MSEKPIDDTSLNLFAERRRKLAAWRATGSAYPNDFERLHYAAKLNEVYGQKSQEELAQLRIDVAVAGRMMLKRLMGKAAFATLQDMSGRIQIYLTHHRLGDLFETFKHWDLGDILGVTGQLFKTRTGELTIDVEHIKLLVKNLRPLPEKYHGLADPELKYRQRYLDLIINEPSRQRFLTRIRLIQAIRTYLLDHGFLEVETPMLHPIPGGANARPFATHHHALDMPMYLRIAPELYLKRLVVGGFEKVFEINRNFRNEGLSTRHNPEFTMLEFYEAYTDYRKIMDFTEGLIRHAARTTLEREVFTYQGHTIDLTHPFPRLTLLEAIRHYHPGWSLTLLTDPEWLHQKLIEYGGEETLPPHADLGLLQLRLFEYTTEEKLIAPTFIIDYPASVSPLARRSSHNPQIAERFELFIAGREIANGFSELNDPEEQATCFLDQLRAKEAGDQEAMYYDADYIRALEIGLPPTGGCGIGIDRLVMLLTDAPSIRDVILFPAMRPEASVAR